MKQVFVTGIMLLMMNSAVHSQQSTITNIIPSSAPAFSVLGISPTEISKPNSWNALQASLYQNLVTSNGIGIPKDFAVEFTPYWLKDHPDFTYQNYMDKKSFGLRNLAVSIASAKVQYGKDSVQGMGFGFRLPLIAQSEIQRKTINQSMQDVIEAKRKKQRWQSEFVMFVTTFTSAKVSDFLDTIMKNLQHPVVPLELWKDNAAEIQSLYTDTLQKKFLTKGDDAYSADMGDILATVSEYFNVHNNTDAAEITDMIASALKQGSNLEISGALGMVFPTNDFNYSRVSRIALWSDYSFHFSKKGDLEGTAALRLIRDSGIDTIKASTNADAVFRFTYAIGTKQKFTVSAWGLLRYKTITSESMVINNVKYFTRSDDWDNKYGIDICYKLSDNIAFAYSFGKNYGKDIYTPQAGSNTLINYFNLFYSLNTKIQKNNQDQYLFKSF